MRWFPAMLMLFLLTGCIQEAKWTWTGDTPGEVTADQVKADGTGEVSPSDVPGGEDADVPAPKDTVDTVEPKDTTDTFDTPDICVPNCTGKECGDDNCGGSCGICDDDDPCNGNDLCEEGKCVQDSPPDCDDDNPCTTDSCVEGKGCLNDPVPDKAELGCDDGNPCTEDVCVSGTCANPLKDLEELVVEDCLCEGDEDCEPLEDDDLCNGTLVCDTEAEPSSCMVDEETIVTCTLPDGLAPECNAPACIQETSGCIVVYINEDGLCSDGDACTQGDKCNQGQCKADGPVTCNDANGCTDDSCDPETGCVFTPNAEDCDDTDACTYSDTCLEGACTGIQYSCDDPTQCETAEGAVCNGDGTCTYPTAPMEGTPCDDGDACTQDEACVGGTCTGGSAVVCDDGNVCTDDACVMGEGCDHVPGNEGGPCLDSTGTCQSGICCVPACEGKQCGEDGCGGNCGICDEHYDCLTGSCVYVPWCGDGSCDGAEDACLCPADCPPLCLDGCCTHNESCATCVEDCGCPEGDVCFDGACCTPACDGMQCGSDGCGGSCGECDDGDQCTLDTCLGGTCDFDMEGMNGYECDDGTECTFNDACFDGDCLATPAPEDQLEWLDCFCDGVEDCALVDDGVECNGEVTCVSEQCTVGVAVPCDDGNDCTEDICDPVDDCVFPAIADGLPCDDDTGSAWPAHVAHPTATARSAATTAVRGAAESATSPASARDRTALSAMVGPVSTLWTSGGLATTGSPAPGPTCAKRTRVAWAPNTPVTRPAPARRGTGRPATATGRAPTWQTWERLAMTARCALGPTRVPPKRPVPGRGMSATPLATVRPGSRRPARATGPAPTPQPRMVRLASMGAGPVSPASAVYFSVRARNAGRTAAGAPAGPAPAHRTRASRASVSASLPARARSAGPTAAGPPAVRAFQTSTACSVRACPSAGTRSATVTRTT